MLLFKQSYAQPPLPLTQMDKVTLQVWDDFSNKHPLFKNRLLKHFKVEVYSKDIIWEIYVKEKSLSLKKGIQVIPDESQPVIRWAPATDQSERIRLPDGNYHSLPAEVRHVVEGLDYNVKP